jgi:hypothetical protein
MLKDEIKKNQLEKIAKKIIWINLLNLWSMSWDRDKFIESKSKKLWSLIFKFQQIKCWKLKLRGKKN